AMYRNFDHLSSTELLWVTVPPAAGISNSIINFCVVYIPPDPHKIPGDLNKICQFFEHECQLSPNDNFVLIGDFNLPCVSWAQDGYTILRKGSVEVQHASTQTLDLLTQYGLKQFNCTKNFANNTLDLVFSNLPIHISPVTIPLLREDRAHPSFTFTILDLYITPLQEATSEPRRNFQKACYTDMNNFFNKQDWQNILCNFSVDEAVNTLYNIIYECVNLYVPTIHRSGKRSYPKWYSPALIKIIKEKTKAHHRWKKYGNLLDYDEFALLRTRERHIQKECFSYFTKNCGDGIKKHPKTFWSFIKALRGGSVYPKKFLLRDKEFTAGQDICNAFCSYFESVFEQPDSTSLAGLLEGAAELVEVPVGRRAASRGAARHLALASLREPQNS
ncbi:hypothetical protein ACJJTC_001885, partial [Scirpophaga incertulas]